MTLDLDDARRFHEAIRQVLLHEWDPIGVAHCPQAHDEYDSLTYLFTSNQVPFDKLVLTYLRQRGLVK